MMNTKKHISLLKLSSKKSFQQLQKKSPFYCVCLDKRVLITKQFYNHIRFTKNRPKEDLIPRLLMLSLIDDIFEKGKVTENRKEERGIFYKITLKIGTHICSIIVLENESQHRLLSCFLD